MKLAGVARPLSVAAVTAAATMLAVGAAVGPLFYPQPRAGRWTLETQLRFFAPFIAPFAGASLAGILVGGDGGRRALTVGAVAALGLVLGMRTRPWVPWTGTAVMARDNALWVGGAVFISALLGSLAASRIGFGETIEAAPGRARGFLGVHLAFFAASLTAGAMLSRHSGMIEVVLLGLAGVGSAWALLGPSRRPGAEALRLSGTALLGWLAGVLWRETS